MAGPAFCAHCIQASIPAWACSGVPAVICSRADAGARYKIMYLVIGLPPRELTLRGWQLTPRGSTAKSDDRARVEGGRLRAIQLSL
jgi:hypothetical protein